jgi:hypothetical protein
MMITNELTAQGKELVVESLANMKTVLDSTPWEYKPVDHAWFGPEPVMALHYKQLCYLPTLYPDGRKWRVIRAEATNRVFAIRLGFSFDLEDIAAIFLVKIADLVNWSKLPETALMRQTLLRQTLIEFYENAKILEIAALHINEGAAVQA